MSNVYGFDFLRSGHNDTAAHAPPAEPPSPSLNGFLTTAVEVPPDAAAIYKRINIYILEGACVYVFPPFVRGDILYINVINIFIKRQSERYYNTQKQHI